ncbi:MAG TPA: SpoIID/LytB domain-containing protein [Candidatus Wallbacteria bacterium]|nr:SpoIID/LytB domain-containing protein [Candidatus Wallbacteria bacterium]
MKKYFSYSLFIMLVFTCLLVFAGDAWAKSIPSLKVGIVKASSSITLSNVDYSSSKEYSNVLKKNRIAQNFTLKLETYKDSRGKQALKVGGIATGASKFKIYPKKNSFVKINGAPYRGDFDIIIIRGSIYVINNVTMEDYLKGLLSCEMEPESDIEALKAQAVVARTYALTTSGKHKSLGYDVCNSTCCQVYKGVAHETEKTNRAVEQTEGAVIEYKGKLINSYYCSACGGQTESVEEAWPGASSKKYLKVIKCDYCSADGRVAWTYRISKKEFVSKMRQAGFNLTGVISSKSEDRTGSGRFYTVEIEDPSGPVFCSVEVIRKAFGNSNIKSNYFNVAVEGGRSKFRPSSVRKIDDIIKEKSSYNRANLENSYVTFSGSGHGHGVGMCQHGAKKMAAEGKNYKDILKYYFTREINVKRIY